MPLFVFNVYIMYTSNIARIYHRGKETNSNSSKMLTDFYPLYQRNSLFLAKYLRKISLS